MTNYYAVRLTESTEDYKHNHVYACSYIYDGKIDILNHKGDFIQHDFGDYNFMFVINPALGIFGALGYPIGNY